MRLIFLFSVLSIYAFGQDHSFPFGQATYRELEMKTYDKDTSATALVLNEFGEAYIQDGDDYNLIFEYHVKIKILKQDGLSEATIEIPLYKSDTGEEKLKSYNASFFNIENGSLKETKLDAQNVFQEKSNKRWNTIKMAMPNVRLGSVIEYQYKIESPFIYNFRPWSFQGKLPKLRSDYLALIPANYNYNITLRGFLELSKNENRLIKQCFYQGKADCSELKFSMVDVPAFIEEDYMTAKSNFLSTLNFELSEVRYFDGRTVKYTEEWHDADIRMQRHEDFGIQLRKGKDVFKDQLEVLAKSDADSAAKARNVYNFIRDRYQWNGNQGSFCENGIKKTFEERKGNVSDINLSLVAALRYVGVNADPVILSTRENGSPIEVHPVLSDFNYVIAKVTLNSKTYLLDATDDFSAFGTIPIRCINGKGRVMNEKGSYWIELKPTDKEKISSNYSLVLSENGTLSGAVQKQYSGYEAITKRKEIAAIGSEEEYINSEKKRKNDFSITKMELVNVDNIEKPLIEKYEFEMKEFLDLKSDLFLFNPFIEGKIKNPFKSSERSYPVDFGAPVEEAITVTLTYPETFDIAGTPEKVALSLPNAGGRFLFGTQSLANKITMSNNLTVTRTVYSSQEYHYLKELYNRMVQVQESDWVFKRRQ
jgi:hypothetical protein